ncbi:hypothetical protein [Photobacterium sanguinicancri]|uniref:hypothetical protein n=1 Tax=Photobacterium sanguinicancri TaxID=875932 RepID=UPI0026E33ECC|nr:hypothetical protein [Photobacterium sanguinicancri]MDO6498047.1 hypothetical protein [Photobacterium sanguinicancri]
MRYLTLSVLISGLLSAPLLAKTIDFSCAGTCDQTVLCEVLSEHDVAEITVEVVRFNGDHVEGGKLNDYMEYEFTPPEENYSVVLNDKKQSMITISGQDINVPCKCKCPPIA